MIEVHNCDCLEYLETTTRRWDCIFADPPDNIGLKYGEYSDKVSYEKYFELLHKWLAAFVAHADSVWFSFNARWWTEVARASTFARVLGSEDVYEHRLMLQTFTFGQHRTTDFGNNFRPLLRIQKKGTEFYGDAIRIESARQRLGDKRANPDGRVPGDVFAFPRVTGNSEQRRSWHPTQLHEGLVERCIRSCVPDGGTVLDPFAGTGTTGRVCKHLGLDCTLLEIDATYCRKIADDLGCTNSC